MEEWDAKESNLRLQGKNLKKTTSLQEKKTPQEPTIPVEVGKQVPTS